MVYSLAVTVFPAAFLAVLFGGGALFHRRNVDQDGEPPIDRTVFYVSKYSVVVLWVAMVLQAWGVRLSWIDAPLPVWAVSLCLWVAGFTLLFGGRFGLGSSFRLGSPNEATHLETNCLFRLSRNPMYLGVFATLTAAVLCTLNPVLLAIALFVGAVHHRIVLAEEQYMRQAFGQEYTDYCGRVPRYL